MKRLRYVRLSAGRRAAIWGVFLLATVMGLLCVAVLHMKPILTNLAAASVSNTVNRIVVTAVYDAVSAGEVDYDTLVHLEKDQSGHVHHRGGDGPLCRLCHETLYPCATAEHEIKRTPVASPASFWYFVDHFHREQIKSV